MCVCAFFCEYVVCLCVCTQNMWLDVGVCLWVNMFRYFIFKMTYVISGNFNNLYLCINCICSLFILPFLFLQSYLRSLAYSHLFPALEYFVLLLDELNEPWNVTELLQLSLKYLTVALSAPSSWTQWCCLCHVCFCWIS